MIGDDPQNTEHFKIKTKDLFIPLNLLEKDLFKLKNLLSENRVDEIKILLGKLIELFKSNTKIVDNLYIEESIYNKHEKNKILDEEKTETNNHEKVVKFIK